MEHHCHALGCKSACFTSTASTKRAGTPWSCSTCFASSSGETSSVFAVRWDRCFFSRRGFTPTSLRERALGAVRHRNPNPATTRIVMAAEWLPPNEVRWPGKIERPHSQSVPPPPEVRAGETFDCIAYEAEGADGEAEGD